jgi:CelD/BcsL family acetyltransferase involved in cellulose biosynthesis
MLFAASADRSFFLSPVWVGAWMETYGATLNAEIVLFEDAATVVGAVILVSAAGRGARRLLRRLFLHTAGEAPSDTAFVEYVAPLSRDGWSDAVTDALRALVASRRWDELVLEGVTEANLIRFRLAGAAMEVETQWRPTYYVDLARIRGQGQRYDAMLSRNTRSQLNRSLKLYGERGDPSIEFATDTDEARQFFRELETLHQARWEARGVAGSFASARWREFHERVIARGIGTGSVQLVRLRVGSSTMGVLYNFVQDGVVSFCQSGLQYESDNRLKPGLVIHALVIQACMDRGFATYDLLASGPEGSRYKESLATDSAMLGWAVIQRPTVRARIFRALRGVKRWLLNDGAAAAPDERPES